MKIFIFDIPVKEMTHKEFLPLSTQQNIIINPIKSNMGTNTKFEINIITPDSTSEVFNIPRLQNIATCKDIETAKRIAKLIIFEENNFINM